MANEEFEIEARVAEVTSDIQLALNAGSGTGVQVGDTVTLHRRVEVKDPITQERLGEVLYPRLRLTVKSVNSKFSLATVVDRYAPKATTALVTNRVTRLKKVTKFLEETGEGFVHVEIGEIATIARPEADTSAPANSEDKPPF